VRVVGQGSPTIVFVPDPPNVIEHYDELCELLSPLARVVCFEMPGFGFSFPPFGFQFTLEEQVATAADILCELALSPYALAFSCGSAYGALRLAVNSPNLVERLILIQAPSWPEERRWAARVDRGGLVRRPVVGQALLAVGKRRVARRWYRAALSHQSQADKFIGPCLDAFDEGACFCLASGFQANFARDIGFAPVEQPVLVLWGLADRTHRHSDKSSVLQYAPHAQWVEFADAGHFPELEQPARFAEVAGAFIGC
jgi:pimeloyl-ACP methyl ester carboxylesterase